MASCKAIRSRSIWPRSHSWGCAATMDTSVPDPLSRAVSKKTVPGRCRQRAATSTGVRSSATGRGAAASKGIRSVPREGLAFQIKKLRYASRLCFMKLLIALSAVALLSASPLDAQEPIDRSMPQPSGDVAVPLIPEEIPAKRQTPRNRDRAARWGQRVKEVEDRYQHRGTPRPNPLPRSQNQSIA